MIEKNARYVPTTGELDDLFTELLPDFPTEHRADFTRALQKALLKQDWLIVRLSPYHRAFGAYRELWKELERVLCDHDPERLE